MEISGGSYEAPALARYAGINLDAVTDVFGALRQIFSRQGLHTYTSQITGHAPASSSGSQPQPRFESVVGIYQLAGDAANSGLRDVQEFSRSGQGALLDNAEKISELANVHCNP